MCVENEKFWFGALLEGLFHILERKYSQKNVNFWKQKLLLLLFLLIKKYIQVSWACQKVSFVYSKEPPWKEIFRQKSAQIKRAKTCSKVS